MEKKEVKVKDSRMHSLVVLFDIHTDIFGKAVEGISDADAVNRMNTKANHMAWIAGAIAAARYEMAEGLGVDLKAKSLALFEGHSGLKENEKYPTLAEINKDWDAISPLLREAFCNVSTEKLDTEFEMMPGAKMTWYDLYSFMMYREANHMGQMALYRRLLGYDAIKYM